MRGRRGENVSKYVQSFKDLDVYNVAVELQQVIFEITKTFPKDEMFSLTDQIRRSSRSVGANIAEAWQKRRYKAHFVSKLTDADSEQAETQHWLDTALACKYISLDLNNKLGSKCLEIGRMLGSIINNADSWCQLNH